MSGLVAVSVVVGDGAPEPALDHLVKDLARICHDSAVAHYGRRGPCEWQPFAAEAFGGREAFEAALGPFPAAAGAEYLAEWDAARRPVAIIHVFTDDPFYPTGTDW